MNYVNFKCQFCGASSNLTGHHKWPRRLREDLKFDPNNGILLCRTCHWGAEKLFRLVEPQYRSIMPWL